MKEIGQMTTESTNHRSENLDQMTTRQIVQLMNEEDQKVAEAVAGQIDNIVRLVEATTQSLQIGGRLIYIGAGTSGRLGVLDAAECPPTFGTDPELVVGLIAGGKGAMFQAVENAEDSETMAKQDLQSLNLKSEDMVIGIAASGRTPYVVYGLKYATEIGCTTGAVVCNEDSDIAKVADIAVEVVVGPEVLTGSTRMKAGTAQKMVLNMVSTISMIGIGKTYKNYMVDLCQTNQKLEIRALNMIQEITGCDQTTASDYLRQAEGSVKIAITAILGGFSIAQARERLQQSEGKVTKAIQP